MAPNKTSAKVLQFIRGARLREGDQLPAEIDLARELGMSRNSIREAYARLSAQGLLIRRHGIGTFVARAPIENDFAQRRAFWRAIESAGFAPGLEVMAEERIEADRYVGEQLGIETGTVITKLTWRFLADQRPVVLIEHFIAPYIRSDGIVWENKHNLLATLNDQMQIEGAELEVWTTAINADAHIARMLTLEPGTAVVHGFARVHSGDGRIPAISRHWSNPDLISIGQRLPLRPPKFRD